MFQMIRNQVNPKVHQNGVSSCVLHQCDLNGSATSMWDYHHSVYIIWHQCYEHVYHYYQDSTEINHSLQVHVHKRYYPYK